MNHINSTRKVEIAVISDVHLGTFGCRAKELLNYLKSIEPETIILNGDIIDIWQFNKRYFPKSHMRVILYITSLLAKGTKVYYVTGNHDEMLRKFKGFSLGSFEIVNKLILDLNGQKAWFFHGDVFDVIMKNSKWLAQLGGVGYDMLIMINTLFNYISTSLGRGRISFSKKVKSSVKGALKHIDNFEETAANIAIAHGYQYVVCGHIHQPQMRVVEDKEGRKVNYLNSGDWVENMTSLEYNEGQWSIYHYLEDPIAQSIKLKDIFNEEQLTATGAKGKTLFNNMLEEFQSLKINS
jgi:UDP-2,3-diacylglucosamine pyrophosphatase LpxH